MQPPTVRPRARLCVLLLLLFALSALCDAHSSTYSIISPAIREDNADGVALFSLFEVEFTPSIAFSNPFDSSDVLVQAHFQPPSGSVLSVDAFWFQDFSRFEEGIEGGGGAEKVGVSEEDSDNEADGSGKVKEISVSQSDTLAPVGSPRFRVRFSPLELGAHSFYLTAVNARGDTERTNTSTFTSVDPKVAGTQGSGFVRASTNQQYFETWDGRAFYPVGENLCWANSSVTYETFFKRLSDAGGNYARLWLADGDLFELQGNRTGLQNLDLEAAWHLDYVMSLAEQLDLRVLLTLSSFNLLSTHRYGQWAESPYNAANGGPCTHPHEFFSASNEAARDAWRRYARYVVARWGFSANVFAYELWNEVDATNAYATHMPEVREWHVFAATFLKELDFHRHMVTTSFALSANFEHETIAALPQLDFVQTHTYGEPDMGHSISKKCLTAAQLYGRPHFVGEYGLTTGEGALRKDAHGLSLHNGMWASVASLGSGTAMYWWWDDYVDVAPLYLQFTAVSVFTKQVEWNRFRWQPTHATIHTHASSLEVIEHARVEAILGTASSGPAGGLALVLWIQDARNTWFKRNYLHTSPAPLTHAVLRLTTLPYRNSSSTTGTTTGSATAAAAAAAAAASTAPTTLLLRWFDTRAGVFLGPADRVAVVEGEAIAVVPAFTNDIACLVEA